jgi:hypothetical protein
LKPRRFVVDFQLSMYVGGMKNGNVARLASAHGAVSGHFCSRRVALRQANDGWDRSESGCRKAKSAEEISSCAVIESHLWDRERRKTGAGLWSPSDD